MERIRREVPRIVAATVLSVLLAAWWAAPTRALEDVTTEQTLLNAESALNTAHEVGNIGPGTGRQTLPLCRESAAYLVWSAGVSAGAVTVESSYTTGYAGTWAPLAVVATTAASRTDLVQITGVHRYLRTRISTAVVGGTVSTFFVCN